MSTISASTTSTTAYKVTADTTGALVLQTGATPTTAVTIDGSQNVGVGTASPTQHFEISGTSTQYLSAISTNGANAGIRMNSSGNRDFGIFSDGAMRFYDFTAGAERARIDSSGSLLVGTTSALLSSAKVNVFNTTGGTGGLAVGYGSSAGQYRAMYLISANGGLYFDSGTNAAYLNSAGAWTNASDARLKNNITDIKYGLSAVLNTQPRSYKMNDLEGEYIGFVAQELQQVIPEVVSGDPEKQLGVDYGSLVAVAFKAIQEQQALITQLQADVAALKGAA